jgi:hypothetical protein
MIEPGPAPPWQLRDVVRLGPLMGFARARPHHLQVASTIARRGPPDSAVLICGSSGSISSHCSSLAPEGYRAVAPRTCLGAFRGTRQEPEQVSLARRPRLGPNRVAHELGILVCQRRSRRRRTCGDGWVGIIAESRGCSGGRPRLGGTPVMDETVPAGCYATGGGPFPLPTATYASKISEAGT